MGRFIDWYAILNVPADASAETIRTAYEARLAEPAVPGESPEEVAARRGLLDRAFAVLGDEQRRMAYDMTGEGGYEEGEGRERMEFAPVADPSLVAAKAAKGTYASRSSRARKNKSPRFPLCERTTLVLGGAFAMIVSTFWSIAVYSSQTSTEPSSPLGDFLAAVSTLNGVGLWIVFALGSFFAWLFMIVLIFALPRYWEYIEVRSIEGETNFLFLLILISLMPGFMALLDNGPLVYKIRLFCEAHFGLIAKFLICFFILIVASAVKKRGIVDAVFQQLSIMTGHMLLVNCVAYLAMGQSMWHVYFTGELAAFGFLTWWIAACGCYMIYERVTG